VKRLAVLALCLAASTGCGTIESGKMPDVSAFHGRLTARKSTKADVLKVLGSPRGFGKVTTGKGQAPHVIWEYDYVATHTATNRVDLNMLLVFFDGEVMDGYLWFESKETVGSSPK